MQVQVVDRLPAVFAGVDHHAIALGEAQIDREFARRGQQVAEQTGILPGGVGK